MRELDVLLTNYLETTYPASAEHEKAAFQRLLSLPDPELIAYVLNAESPADEELRDVIDRIRGGDPS